MHEKQILVVVTIVLLITASLFIVWYGTSLSWIDTLSKHHTSLLTVRNAVAQTEPHGFFEVPQATPSLPKLPFITEILPFPSSKEKEEEDDLPPPSDHQIEPPAPDLREIPMFTPIHRFP